MVEQGFKFRSIDGFVAAALLLGFWGYVILQAMGQYGPENYLWFSINSPGRAVFCYLRAGQAAKVVARAISNWGII